MTQVDFYILSSQSAQQRVQFACRLVDKIFQMGKRVYIHTESAEQTSQLDDLLWTWKQNSFIPHSLYQDADKNPAPVLIGHDEEPDANSDALVNLSAEVPMFFSRFERVAELIDHAANVREAGRERYRFYKDRGYPLKTHEIKN